MIAEQSLRTFARQERLRVSACNGYSANVGETERYQVRLQRGGYRITVGAAETLVVVRLALLEGTLVFALNRPDCIMLLDEPVDVPCNVAVFSCTPWTPHVDAWLRDPRHTAFLEALGLGTRESAQVCANRIIATVEPTRDIMVLIDTLIPLADALPRCPSEADEPDVASLPSHLRPLARYFSRLAIPDDEQRAERLTSLSRKRVSELLTEVAPLLGDINAYLDSFGDSPQSDAALCLGYLAEAVAELQARTGASS